MEIQAMVFAHKLLATISYQSLARVGNVELLSPLLLVEHHKVVLVPMEMQGSGASCICSIETLPQMLCKPNLFAASLMPSRDTPSVVAKQYRERVSMENSFP
jgi:hypothetical protein